MDHGMLISASWGRLLLRSFSDFHCFSVSSSTYVGAFGALSQGFQRLGQRLLHERETALGVPKAVKVNT